MASIREKALALAAHVLDVLLAVSEAAESGRSVDVASTVSKPVPLTENWDPVAATL